MFHSQGDKYIEDNYYDRLKLNMKLLVSFKSGYLGCTSKCPPKLYVAITQWMGPHNCYIFLTSSLEMLEIPNHQGNIFVASVGKNLNLFQKCGICDRNPHMMLSLLQIILFI